MGSEYTPYQGFSLGVNMAFESTPHQGFSLGVTIGSDSTPCQGLSPLTGVNKVSDSITTDSLLEVTISSDCNPCHAFSKGTNPGSECSPYQGFSPFFESTTLRGKKGLSALKAMVAKGIKQRHLFLLYRV